VKEDTETLAELMLHADQFCSRVEAAAKDAAPSSEETELRTKLGQCRTQLAYLQSFFDDDKLDIEDPLICAAFRTLVMSLMWVAFYARAAIDFKMFRMLVRVEAGFTYLLIGRSSEERGPNHSS
jgi:hypothetical protein